MRGTNVKRKARRVGRYHDKKEVELAVGEWSGLQETVCRHEGVFVQTRTKMEKVH